MKFQSLTLLLLALLGLTAPEVHAQSVLTLREALEITLRSNYDIQLRQFDTEIAAMQVNPALVGRRPEIVLSGNYEFGWSDTYAEVLSFSPDAGNTELDLDGISNDIILGVEFRMNLIDGRAGRYQLDKLRTASELSRLQLQQTIETSVFDVTTAYLEMARQQSFMEVTEQSIQVNLDRLARVAGNEEFGVSTSLDRLQIEVDLKTDSASLRNQMLDLENARRNLNYLMGSAYGDDYLVETTVISNRDLVYPELETAMLNRNSFLKLGDKSIVLAELDVELSKAAFRPTLQGYANANFAYLQDQANFLQINRAIGPNVGLRFNYQISAWGGRKIKRESALLTQEQTTLERAQLQEELVKELQNAYAIYQNAIAQLDIERSNLVIFEQNLENLQNMYDLGTATNTDVRSAQLNLNAAQNRINNYQYTIKQAEIALYLLSGELTE